MNRFRVLIFVFLLISSSLYAQSGPPGLSIIGGNGQVLQEQFPTSMSTPMAVQARDSSGKPIAGLPITWTLTVGAGSIIFASPTTDANGQATAGFEATNIQPGQSYLTSYITASSTVGSANFVLTTVPQRLLNGTQAAPPLAQVVTPATDNPVISGRPGATLPGAIVVRVVAQSGIGQGLPVPNVGVRIVLASDPTQPIPAACNGPGGIVLTDGSGTAQCDLVLGQGTGSLAVAAEIGEYVQSRAFTLQFQAGSACTYSLSQSTVNVSDPASSGTVTVNTAPGCAWTAASNVSWITVTGGNSGTGNGVVTYSVATNTGAARTGTLTIAGVTYTVNQTAAGSSLQTITIQTARLPGGQVNSAYSTALVASGGQPPYTWSIPTGALPPGLVLNGNGQITGTPISAGTYNFTIKAVDAVGGNGSAALSITVSSSGQTPVIITNSSFPPGMVGVAYAQTINVSGACQNLFVAVPAFSIAAGSLPAGLSLKQVQNTYVIAGTPTTSGTSNFTLAVTDACARTATANFSITITGQGNATASIAASPTALNFTVPQGGTRPADQSIAITTPGAVLTYTASASTSNGGSWLAITNSPTGTTPGAINAGLANYAGLSPGSYNGSIIIISQASNNPLVIPVTLTVGPGVTLTASPTALNFNLPNTGANTSAQQSLSVTASGSSVGFSATATAPWLTVSPGSASTPGTVTVTANATGLTAGNYTGSVVLAPGGTPVVVPVTLAVTNAPVLAVSMQTVPFVYQQGSPAPAIQAIAVTSTGGPVKFAIFTSTASGGNWLNVTLPPASTPANLGVSVDASSLPAGNYSGTIRLVPSDGSVSAVAVAVTLTVSPGVPTITSVTNAASFATGPIAPGEYVTIFGTFIGPSTPASGQIINGALSTSLSGTRVLFDGTPGPLVYVSATQVSAIAPYSLDGRVSTQIQVEYQGVPSSPITIRIAGSAPGIFTLDQNGQGAILNQDNTINSSKNGAAAGSIISIYATGEGAVIPQGVDGVIIGATLPMPRLPVTATIGGQPADILYAGSAPGLPAGALQVNARIPEGTVSGTAAIVLKIGDASSQTGVTVAIQ